MEMHRAIPAENVQRSVIKMLFIFLPKLILLLLRQRPVEKMCSSSSHEQRETQKLKSPISWRQYLDPERERKSDGVTK